MNTDSKRLFHKPILAAATGWAVLLISTVFFFAARKFMPDFALMLIFIHFVFVIFILVWTAVAFFGILQGWLDLKQFQSMKSRFTFSEKRKRILLCAAGMALNLLLIVCNTMIIFRLYHLWNRLFS